MQNYSFTYRIQSQMPKKVNIYTEFSPNPNAMKFVLDFFLIKDEQIFEFKNQEEAQDSPLAASLLAFEYVESVFFMHNFITINKKTAIDWYEIVSELRLFLKQYLEADKAIFKANFLDNREVKLQESEVTDNLILKINQILEDYIKPAVESDGGAIDFNNFDPDTGTLKVNLKGSCSGCPSASLTLKEGIENLMTRFIPEVKYVVANEI